MENQSNSRPPSPALTHTILEFLAISPAPIMTDMSDDSSDSCFIKSAIYSLVVADPVTRQQAASVLDRLLTHLSTAGQWLQETKTVASLNLPKYIWAHRYVRGGNVHHLEKVADSLAAQELSSVFVSGC